MPTANKQPINRGTSPAFLLFLTFLVLKLTGVIGWSGWWVTCPLWGTLALVALAFLIPCAVAALVTVVAFVGVFLWGFFRNLFKRGQ